MTIQQYIFPCDIIFAKGGPIPGNLLHENSFAKFSNQKWLDELSNDVNIICYDRSIKKYENSENKFTILNLYNLINEAHYNILYDDNEPITQNVLCIGINFNSETNEVSPIFES